MNKVTMFVWGLIIFLIWGVIILIAYKQQDRDYVTLAADLKSVTKKYIDKEKINLKFNESYKVYIDDLKESNYINNDEKINDYCIDSIVVTKNLFNYSYEINKECKDKE